MELRVKGDALVNSHTDVTTTIFKDRLRIRTGMTMRLIIVLIIEGLRTGVRKRECVYIRVSVCILQRWLYVREVLDIVELRFHGHVDCDIPVRIVRNIRCRMIGKGGDVRRLNGDVMTSYAIAIPEDGFIASRTPLRRWRQVFYSVNGATIPKVVLIVQGGD